MSGNLLGHPQQDLPDLPRIYFRIYIYRQDELRIYRGFTVFTVSIYRGFTEDLPSLQDLPSGFTEDLPRIYREFTCFEDLPGGFTEYLPRIYPNYHIYREYLPSGFTEYLPEVIS